MLQKGERVRIVDEIGEGRVLSVSGSECSVLIDGFEMRYPVAKVVKVDATVESASSAPPEMQLEKWERRSNKRMNAGVINSSQTTYEIDLHIEELVDRPLMLSNHEIVQVQLNACRAFIQEAFKNRYPKVVIIHGVGEGVLKDEVRHYLHRFENVEFHDAPYRKYGYGATEVLFRH